MAEADAYRQAAKERQGTSTGGSNPQLVEAFPQADTGKSRDKAGERVGVSGKAIDKAAKVHHIVKIEQRPDLRLCIDNLRSLCRDCHIVRTARGE